MRVWLVVAALVGCHSAAPPATPAPAAPAPPPAAPAPAPGTAIDGYWTGVLGGQLHLAVTVAGEHAVLDSIDQHAKLPIDKLAVIGGTRVHFEIASIGGSYDGTVAGDRIDGTWRQTGVPPQPLELVRGTPPPPGEEPKAAPPVLLDAPIDVTVPEPPVVLHADGREHLVYELHVTSYSSLPVALERVEVKAGVRSLAVFDRDALAKMGTAPELRSQGHETVFVWVDFDGAAPKSIEHALTVKVAGQELAVAGPTVPVVAGAPRVIAPPLRGSGWFSANGPSNTSAHRRALIPIGGRARIAQRFAIDWVKLGADGKTFTGDATKNASYHAYGQDALAVAPGTVVEVKDGIAENVPQQEMAVPLSLDTVAGNHVLVDLGRGTFAMWAHLQPGSIKVKVGDKVKTGQVLGLVGNSGHSTEPHLHFQLMDAPSPLGAEGLPYAFAKLATHREGEPETTRRNEMPAEDELVSF